MAWSLSDKVRRREESLGIVVDMNFKRLSDGSRMERKTNFSWMLGLKIVETVIVEFP